MTQILLVLLVVVGVAILIVKKYKAEAVLLCAGLILMLATYIFGWGDVLSKNAKSTGISWLDPLSMITHLFSSRAAGLGLQIMALVGFARYMDHIGANEAVVRVSIKPLHKVKSAYTLLFFAFVLACFLHLAVSSAAGLAVLLMGTMFPVMIRLGLSVASSAAVVATSLAVSFTPTTVDAIRAVEAVKEADPTSTMDVVKFVVHYQGPAALATVLVIGVMHIFWQRYCDKKEGTLPKNPSDVKIEEKALQVPKFYALLPLVPIIIAFASSEFVVKGVNIDITTLVLISMVICMLVEFLRKPNFKELCAGFEHFLQGMGHAFTHVVALLVAAGVFAHGITSTGAVNQLIHMAESASMPAYAIAVVFAAITFLAAVIMGSGNAPFLAFVELIPAIAVKLGANSIAMILPMQQASNMGRAMSPVSGVVIATATNADISPFEVVKRTSVPLVVGFIFHTVLIGVLYL